MKNNKKIYEEPAIRILLAEDIIMTSICQDGFSEYSDELDMEDLYYPYPKTCRVCKISTNPAGECFVIFPAETIRPVTAKTLFTDRRLKT